MTELQWGLFHADLNPIRGSEQGGRRPVLVISRELINRSIPVVGICPLTSLKPGRRVYATEVSLPKGTGGLAADSLVMAHQIRTIAKERLGARIGTLHEKELQNSVRESLRLFLELD